MRRASLLVVAALLAGGCARAPLPVPVFAEPVALRVLVVENPALPPVGEARLGRILDEAAWQAQATFGVTLRFAPPAHMPIGEFFARFDEAFARRAREEWIYDFKRGTGDPARLAADLEQGLRAGGSDFAALHAYAAPHLLAPLKSNDLAGLARAVAATHVARLERLRATRMPAGMPLVADAPYNEFAYWDHAGRHRLGFEVVVTNQILASAEYRNSDLHSSLRGGITNGLTAECGDCAFGTFSLLSTYPFWGADPVVTELRGGHALGEHEAVRAAALLLVHELGHQLFHYGHPFGATACVMNPAPLLRFREWIAGIDPKACEFGRHPTLVPGFYKFEDLRAGRPG